MGGGLARAAPRRTIWRLRDRKNCDDLIFIYLHVNIRRENRTERDTVRPRGGVHDVITEFEAITDSISNVAVGLCTVS